MKELTLRPKKLDVRRSEDSYIKEIGDIVSSLQLKKTEIKPKERDSIDIYLKIEDKDIPLTELYTKLTKDYNLIIPIKNISKEGVAK